MGARTCIVTVTDLRGIRQSVEVTAETVFEAAARALSALRRDAWTDRIGRQLAGKPGAATRRSPTRFQVDLPRRSEWRRVYTSASTPVPSSTTLDGSGTADGPKTYSML